MRKLFSKFGIGSQSTDIPSLESVDNPLPPCPKSLNCIRVTRLVELPLNSAFQASLTAAKSMRPAEINISDEIYRIDMVFNVFFFKDDMILQLTSNDSTSSHLHIRSASRVGFSDLGVNTRRVNKFLRRLARISHKYFIE